jgi:hypothetical protein
VAVPAAAIVAAVATFGGWALSSAAQPAAFHRPVGHIRPLTPDQAGPRLEAAGSPAAAAIITTVASAGQPALLDAFFATSAESAGHRVVSTATASGHHQAAPTARQVARTLLHQFGWSKRQFRYLDPLWSRESSWNVRAENLYSGAYGIPQAVPGDKMASAGRHWRTSARTQILWGLRYIKDRYGSPRAAWSHELATGWY